MAVQKLKKKRKSVLPPSLNDKSSILNKSLHSDFVVRFVQMSVTLKLNNKSHAILRNDCPELFAFYQ